jgi:putative flavoprotein involved in K+ transport
MLLTGKIEDADGSRLRFADDLAERIAEGDAAYDGFCARVEAFLADEPALAATIAPVEPSAADRSLPSGPVELDLQASGITSVIWATGYRHDLGWLPSAVIDGNGNPLHKRGVTAVPGLYFLGLFFQYASRSSVFWGVQDDAAYLADRIAISDGG